MMQYREKVNSAFWYIELFMGDGKRGYLVAEISVCALKIRTRL